MLSAQLTTVLIATLATTAGAQQHSQLRPITTTVRDAGVYHLATGTWTRGVTATALAGPETLYDNTCTVPAYAGLPSGVTGIDSGRIPSTSSPSSSSSLTGLYDAYEVNGFTIGIAIIIARYGGRCFGEGKRKDQIAAARRIVGPSVR